MFTVVVSYYAEHAPHMAENFAEFIKPGGHVVIATNFKKEPDGAATVTQHITTPEPETLFKRIEDFAFGGEEIPESLQHIYFEDAIYYVHAIPKDVTTEQMMYILNIALNVSCVNRAQHNRLRNMYLTERGGSEINDEKLPSIMAIHEAINILSKKVLGTDLLITINKQEETKWPIH
ncbi:hypothetical protein HYQ25_gp043 [Salmonella phage Se-B]|uniref:hypothetical protein n=1 Tax=Salmonella phage Se-B TaxID=2700089 RepID=UPI0018A807C3|nr:hypothetical protein HYQ25_gp043 [Salmonella phage Se-B]